MGQRPGEGQVRASGGLQGQNGQREGEYFREGGYQALPKLHKIRSQIISFAGQQGPGDGRSPRSRHFLDPWKRLISLPSVCCLTNMYIAFIKCQALF